MNENQKVDPPILSDEAMDAILTDIYALKYLETKTAWSWIHKELKEDKRN